MTFALQFKSGSAAALLASVVLCAGCTGLKTSATNSASTAQAKTESKDATLVKAPTDLSFLLSMSFVEAKSISTQQLEFPPYLKIAADSIQVFKYSADGKPLKARARGKVFLEMNFNEPAKALCQEAYINQDEIILRGSPILQRGGSMVEGLDDGTIFYLFGTSLRVIGLHRVNNQTEISSMMPTLGSWAAGPNPLLPPLTENAVPNSIRDSMQRAAEAEMLHQKTRELYGPAQTQDSPPATPPVQPEKDKEAVKPKSAPPPTAPAVSSKKKPVVEIRRAIPSKPSFWNRFRGDKTRA
ncbi:DEAD/DEAH box helicase family protein [Prosthecobacter vanneervenii]|uniref:Uncharacterized protein n=1 Tax=Prosthecobacter vanneervenii TaxID=48466 RepID=A0A7W8DIZ5_9BACT|nr:hypothetical protein [Prosthecobacter vanneervenii]MBB5031624.1 hypothetical protein [Prosthecobacter vanneervenii]